MKTLAQFLFIYVCCATMCGGANAFEISGNLVVSGNYSVNTDFTVLPGILFEAHDIQATNSLNILNRGQISGGIDVCSNCVVKIQNSGVFNATVSLQSGAKFIQVISQSDEITNLGLGSGFDVVVNDGVGLSFFDVMSIASNADSVEFSDTDFNAGTTGGFVAYSNINLTGDIILRFDDITYQPKLLFSNVSGDGIVHVDSDALDPLYVFRTYRVNNDVFMHLTRSTDYARIFNNDMGRFLNDLRISGVDDRLFSKLDSVETMDEINNVLSHSFRINPIKLMRPISLMQSYKSLEIMYIDKGTLFGIEPIVICSSDVFMRGVRPSVSFGLDNLYMKISGYFMDINYSDDINDFGGVSLGIGGDVQYNMRDNDFVRAHIDGGKSFFHVGSVFTNGVVVNNPDGTSIYAGSEYGHIFNVKHGYTLSPFAGVGMEHMEIANVTDKYIYGIGGVDIGYEYDIDGLRNKMVARALARTDGTIGCGVNLSAWSVMDAAGADINIGTIYNNDFGVSLTLSINGRFRF